MTADFDDVVSLFRLLGCSIVYTEELGDGLSPMLIVGRLQRTHLVELSPASSMQEGWTGCYHVIATLDDVRNLEAAWRAGREE